jgi:hypothetical protein
MKRDGIRKRKSILSFGMVETMIDIDTLNKNIELIAEEVHKAWMKEKIEQGFHAPMVCKYYDLAFKEINLLNHSNNFIVPDPFKKYCEKCHTDLYPYSELPENIKEYDRVTVRAVLNAIESIEE